MDGIHGCERRWGLPKMAHKFRISNKNPGKFHDSSLWMGGFSALAAEKKGIEMIRCQGSIDRRKWKRADGGRQPSCGSSSAPLPHQPPALCPGGAVTAGRDRRVCASVKLARQASRSRYAAGSLRCLICIRKPFEPLPVENRIALPARS